MISINFRTTTIDKTTMITITRQNIKARLFIIFMLMITITGCVHNKNSCFEAFGGSILWNQYLTFKFDNKFKQIGSPNCMRNEDFVSFLLSIGILDEKIKREDGNTAIMQFSLISFTNKLNTNQIDDIVNSFSNKYLLEAENMGKNNTRFLHVYSKVGSLIKDKDKVCGIVVASVKDYNAKNMPPDQEYLLQNDIYKTCFLKKYNQIIVLAVSYRMVPDLEKVFWIQDAVDNLNSMSLNIIMNDGKALADIIKTKQKEIFNLKLL